MSKYYYFENLYDRAEKEVSKRARLNKNGLGGASDFELGRLIEHLFLQLLEDEAIVWNRTGRGVKSCLN